MAQGVLLLVLLLLVLWLPLLVFSSGAPTYQTPTLVNAAVNISLVSAMPWMQSPVLQVLGRSGSKHSCWEAGYVYTPIPSQIYSRMIILVYFPYHDSKMKQVSGLMDGLFEYEFQLGLSHAVCDRQPNCVAVTGLVHV